jgi:hypothetical protein
MAIFTKRKLEYDLTGGGILITLGGEPVVIHITEFSSGEWVTTSTDEVWIYAANPYATAALIEITIVSSTFTAEVPGNSGLFLVVPGLIVSGRVDGDTTSPAQISATIISGPDDMRIFGYVNRITP